MNLNQTDRVYIGTIDLKAMTLGSHPLISPPESSTSAAVLLNRYGYPIGVDDTVVIYGYELEVDVEFGGASPHDSVEFAAFYSRKNPAAHDYADVSDSLADSWGSPGSQVAYRVPSAAGGNRLPLYPGGVKFMTLRSLSFSGGSGSPTVLAHVYIKPERRRSQA